MTKSRTALIALAALAASPAPAQLAAGDAPPRLSRCTTSSSANARPAATRSPSAAGASAPSATACPLPVAAAPSPRDQAGGEQRAALAIDTSRCTAVGRDQNCGSVDFLGMGIMIVREIIAGIERRRD